MIRLYNYYGAAVGEHADAIDNIMSIAMNEVSTYIKEHDICPRDTTGYCTMIAQQALAGYTLKRGMDIKAAERRATDVLQRGIRPSCPECHHDMLFGSFTDFTGWVCPNCKHRQ